MNEILRKLLLEFYRRFPDFKSVRYFRVLKYDFDYDIVLVAVVFFSGDSQFDIFKLKYDSCGSPSFVDFIRSYDTEKLGNIAYTALTEL